MEKRLYRKIKEALLYSLTHLYENINLSDISEVVSYSPFYFHRIFTNETGLSFKDYHFKKRMMLSTKLIYDNKEIKITKIAEKLGFSSAANFSRAFKGEFNISPKLAKNHRIADINLENEIIDICKSLDSEISLDTMIQDPFYIIYRKIRGIRGGSLDSKIILNLESIENQIKMNKTELKGNRFILCSDDYNWFKNQKEMTYDVGIEIPNPYEPLKKDTLVKLVDGGLYSRVYLKRDFQNLDDLADSVKYLTWLSEFMYMYWIENNGYFLDSRQGINIIEIDNNTKKIELSCLLSIKKDSKI